MSLQIVAGKPGSGKSYHTVTMLLRYFEDWALFEHKEEKPFERVLYTNLPLNVEKINEYLSKKMASDIDIGHYIQPINEDVRIQFAASGGKFPLAVLPQNAMIVIDEVQRMFGAEMDSDKNNKKFQVEFRNYISTHRHHGHDLIFITQSTDNISKAILSQAEKLYEISNAKSMAIRFPLNIPLADLDVVKEAFGIRNQFYRVSVGKYQGRRVKFDKEITSHVMTKDVYACYSSHILSDVTSDRPSLNLSRPGAILWFAKKHGWHLILKLIVALFLLFWGIYFIRNLPNLLVQGLAGSLTFAPMEAVSRPEITPLPATTTTPKMQPPFPVPALEDSAIAGDVPSCGNPNCTHDHRLPVLKEDEKITAVFPLGVITNNGRRRIGQPVMIEGIEEIIKSTNVRQGVVNFESGKKITVPK